MASVSIVGCGYTGVRLAARLRHLGHPVRGFAARPESVERIAATGAEAVPLNLDTPPPPLHFARQLVYYAVPPPATGEDDPRLARLLAQVGRLPRRIVYFSTTGVYGDHAGAPVDEDMRPAPYSPRAIRRLAAETALREWADARDVSWCILRVPGIYGPGRLPLERLRRLEPAVEPHEAGPGNRIHVEDLVSVAVAAGFAEPAHRRIYNVTDGSDDSHTAFLERVARIAHLPKPPLINRAEAERVLPPQTWSFLRESRRVVNRRMLEELHVDIAFRDLDAGIRASL